MNAVTGIAQKIWRFVRGGPLAGLDPWPEPCGGAPYNRSVQADVSAGREEYIRSVQADIREGREAAGRGPAQDCPHPDGSTAARCWRHGFAQVRPGENVSRETPPPRPWTERELGLLSAAMTMAGKPGDADLGAILDRSVTGIKMRRWRLRRDAGVRHQGSGIRDQGSGGGG